LAGCPMPRPARAWPRFSLGSEVDGLNLVSRLIDLQIVLASLAAACVMHTAGWNQASSSAFKLESVPAEHEKAAAD
jgi:hypothetical protein